MKEFFDDFKKKANTETHSELFGKLSESLDFLREQFAAEFPHLEPDLFLKSRRWLEITGTTYNEDLSESVPTEVEMWVARQITALIESL